VIAKIEERVFDEHPAFARGFSSLVYAAPAALAMGGSQPHWPLAGGPLSFTRCRLLARGSPRPTVEVSLDDLEKWADRTGTRPALEAWRLAATSPRPTWAGLDLGTPRLMGVVNVTPDSFYDGGRHAASATAIAHGRQLAAEGADLIDIGGESTRPGADAVSPAEELARVEPVLSALRGVALLSIDTRKAAVMDRALTAGAAIVNDVSALTFDPASLATAATRACPIVLMHALGDPKTMQDAPRYDDVVLDVYDYLAARIAACERQGIPRARLVIDPGIGFGKTLEHTLDLLRHMTLFHGLGCALLVGVSRKSLIGRIAGAASPEERLPGSLALALWLVGQGIQILRVHDVAATRQALIVWSRVKSGA